MIKPEIELVNGNLSINVKDININDIFEKLHKETGIAFVPSAYFAETRITLELKDVPLRKALKRILSKFSYLVIEKDEKIEKVIVAGKNPILPIFYSKDLIVTSDSNTSTLKGIRIDTYDAKMIPDGMGVKTSSMSENYKDMKINIPTTSDIPNGMNMEVKQIKTTPDGMKTATFFNNMTPEQIERKTSTFKVTHEDDGSAEGKEEKNTEGIEIVKSDIYRKNIPEGMMHAHSNGN
jgi:hypothetical protein